MITITTEYLASQGLSKTFADRFWDKVFILPYDKGCWIWTACCNKRINHLPYGCIGKGPAGITMQSHRASWILHYGPIPKDMCVLHKCDNASCVRPDHLFLGTKRDNNLDKTSKGRCVPCYGERHGMAKLTNAQVLEIRHMKQKFNVPTAILAREFKVSPVTIWEITSRHKWKHI